MMMTDPIAVVARAAAQRLAADYGPGLPSDVEAALLARDAVRRQDQYVDLISLGTLIVAAATLAWTVYFDLKKERPSPPKEVMIRVVRVELQDYGKSSNLDRDMVVNIVVEEVVQSANQIS